MPITKEDFVELLQNIEEIKSLVESLSPTAQQAVELLLKHAGPRLKELGMALVLGVADIKIAQIAKFEQAGFSREDAIFLVQDEWYALARRSRSSRKS